MKWQTWGSSWVLAIALGTIALGGCQNSASRDGGGKTEVEFWTMQLQPQFTPYFETLIAQYEQTHPGVAIKWVDVPWSAMESKVLTAVAAKTAPDVVNLNPTFASQLASKEAWLTLNDRLTSQQKQTYLPKIWQAGTLNNQTFGLPWYLTTRILLSNHELLGQAGVSQPPQTYAELAQIAAQIKAKTGKYAFFATLVPGDSGEVLESLVQMGVTLVDSQGKAAFNTPAGIAAFRYWVDLYQKDLLPPEVLTQGHAQGVELFQSGQTAFLSTSAEFLKTIQKNAPQLAPHVIASPQLTGETNKRNVAAMNLVIPKDSDQPQAALDFALFVTNSQNQLSFAQAANVLPSTTEAVQQYRQTLNQGEGDAALQQARRVSAEQLNSAEVLVPPIKDLSQLQKLIYENLQAAMLKQKTVEQAVADAAQAWDQRSP